MTKLIIDFEKYSSIKIGSKNEVEIIESSDLGANFIEAKIIDSISFDSNILESNFIESLDFTKSSGELNKNKTFIFHNKTLHFNQILESKNISNITLDSKNYHIIGKANNLLVSPNAKNLAILGNTFNYISILDSIESSDLKPLESCATKPIKSKKILIEIGASTPSLKAFLFFKKHNLQGLEFLQHLPGVIGALCNMNAGMKSYEIANFLHSININGKWISAHNAGLKYRGRESKGVIFAARFYAIKGFRNEFLESFKLMRANQPSEPSCGSCFKNPPNDYAGRLLEAVGLKGFFINGVGFSEKHANFLVNKAIKIATFEDAIKVINLAKKRVKETFDITLECEVKICE